MYIDIYSITLSPCYNTMRYLWVPDTLKEATDATDLLQSIKNTGKNLKF